jgi:hypothetical protein
VNVSLLTRVHLGVVGVVGTRPRDHFGPAQGGTMAMCAQMTLRGG